MKKIESDEPGKIEVAINSNWITMSRQVDPVVEAKLSHARSKLIAEKVVGQVQEVQVSTPHSS